LSDTRELVDRYLRMWKEVDPAARQKAISELWADDASYVHPVISVCGHTDIGAMVKLARWYLTGYVLHVVGSIQAHHNVARFGWRAVRLEGRRESSVTGSTVLVAREDGRLQAAYVFVDTVGQGDETSRSPWLAWSPLAEQ
jgi:hypothetical protein